MSTEIDAYAESLKKLLDEAKKDKRKGRCYVYEEYKSQLQELPLTGIEYEKAICALAKVLEI